MNPFLLLAVLAVVAFLYASVGHGAVCDAALGQVIGHHLRLRPAEVLFPAEHLAAQVAGLHGVAVDQGEDAALQQVCTRQQGLADAANADQRHPEMRRTAGASHAVQVSVAKDVRYST